MNPPSYAIFELDVQPLREHAWLDSLVDAGVVVAKDIYENYDLLAHDAGPTHQPIIDLGSDNDFFATMDNTEYLLYQRREQNPGPSTSG